MWSLVNAQLLLDLPLHSNNVASVQFSPTDDRILSADEAGTIKVGMYMKILILFSY